MAKKVKRFTTFVTSNLGGTAEETGEPMLETERSPLSTIKEIENGKEGEIGTASRERVLGRTVARGGGRGGCGEFAVGEKGRGRGEVSGNLKECRAWSSEQEWKEDVLLGLQKGVMPESHRESGYTWWVDILGRKTI